MKMQPACYDCLSRQLGQLMIHKSVPADLHHIIMERFHHVLHDGASHSQTPPEVSTHFYRILLEHTGIDDFFVEEKELSTRFALELLPDFRRWILQSDRPFETLVKLVICGNIIDYGADNDFHIDKARAHIAKALSMPLDQHVLARFERAIDAADSILYIADNCGEAVFDILLLEKIQTKVTLAVRGKPILNDITRKEVASSGLADFPLIDTGDLTPGVSLENCSPTFRDVLYSADLIIAKGQGNFETLNDLNLPIYHLLCVKCPVISTITATPLGHLLVCNKSEN